MLLLPEIGEVLRLLALGVVLPLALILVNVCSRPYLRWAERRWLATDTLMSVDPSGGFTRLEARVTQLLKAEIQQAADDISQ